MVGFLAFLFYLGCFFLLLFQTINVSHRLAFLLLCWFDWLCMAKIKPVPCGSIWGPSLIQLTLNEIICGRKLVKTGWWERNSACLSFSSLCHCTDPFHKHPWERQSAREMQVLFLRLVKECSAVWGIGLEGTISSHGVLSFPSEAAV